MSFASGTPKCSLMILTSNQPMLSLADAATEPERHAALLGRVEDRVDALGGEILEVERDLAAVLGDLRDRTPAARREALDLGERDLAVGARALVHDAEPSLAAIEHVIGADELAA